MAIAFLKLEKQHIRTVSVTVSSYSSYGQFLEKFAEKVLRRAGTWQRVKGLGRHLWDRLQPSLSLEVDPVTGEVTVSLKPEVSANPNPIAPDVFALPGEIARNGGFRMAICLDEFQQIAAFDGVAVENALRNEVQRQRSVGYVFAGSQPAVMQQMLAPKRPFYKAGPPVFLDKISADEWERFVERQFRRRERAVKPEAMRLLLKTADLIPYDVQRLAHELWDYAELKGKKTIEAEDIERVVDEVVAGQSDYYERLWQQLSGRQRAVLQALAERGPRELFSQAVRTQYRLGPASTVQKALSSLDGQDILDRYQNEYFFLDPIFAVWVQKILR